ncbi:VOC family protein [Jiangella aurantiaca]|uniref:VOC family protein n=1 Tax=Jiangella aurantiaca TaxID=2530373 RepID=A0A4R5ALM0_9ACTN|nr:VOC family protein [Jiangella aurantiaca]TDD71042.1 VOC family protein [Jiangella aurantiaca]
MTSTFAQWTLDVRDVDLMARFWAAALGYRIEPDSDGGGAHLRPPESAPAGTLSVWLQPSAGPKHEKNRNHPDLVAAEGRADMEVERLLGLGATRADVGQTGREGFTVLADPEGNEFCVLNHRSY